MGAEQKWDFLRKVNSTAHKFKLCLGMANWDWFCWQYIIIAVSILEDAKNVTHDVKIQVNEFVLS